MTMHRLLPLLLIPALAACTAQQASSPHSVTIRPPAPVPSLVGYDAGKLTQLFGPPRIDVTEGKGRKLQFANDSCVLDAFLYPGPKGAKPVATYVDTRDRLGSPTDADACQRSLRLR